MTEQDNETESNTNGPQEILQPECRGCLVKLNIQTGIYHIFEMWVHELGEPDSLIADDLARLANIEISPSDRHSKVICKICYNKLHAACLFASYVRKNDYILQQRYAQTLEYGDEWPQPIQVDKNINGCVFENSMQVDIKQEVLSEEEDRNIGIDEDREQNIPHLDIKVEPEELIEQPPIQIVVNGTISYDQINMDSPTDNVMTNGTESNETGDVSMDIKFKVKEEPVSENEEPDPMTDLPLECMLCTKMFSQVSGLKAHVIAQHSYKTVKRKCGVDDPESPQKKQNKYLCVICRRRFSTSTDLMVHETCHNKHVCYGCNEKFGTFRQLSAHSKLCTAILNKSVQKHKTLEDVTRPQLSVKLEQSNEEVKKEIEDTSISSKELSSDNNINSKLDIHSLKSEPISEDSNNAVLEALGGLSGQEM